MAGRSVVTAVLDEWGEVIEWLEACFSVAFAEHLFGLGYRVAEYETGHQLGRHDDLGGVYVAVDDPRPVGCDRPLQARFELVGVTDNDSFPAAEPTEFGEVRVA